MAGIGKYMKGSKFTLKSGNKPAFKMMAGESPITKSPYNQLKDPEDQARLMKSKTAKEAQKAVDGKKGNGWANAGKIALSALTGGLDAVYGSGKVISSSSRLKKKPETKKVKGEENVDNVLGMDKSTITE